MGENSIDGAVREVNEELGLTVDKEKLTLFTSYKRELYKDFVDVYIYKNDIDVSKLTLQKDEVCDVKWATEDEISQMILSGEFINTNNSQYVNEILIWVKNGNGHTKLMWPFLIFYYLTLTFKVFE